MDLFSRNYADYVLWQGIYPPLLSERRGAKTLEIGSAPGEYLIHLKRTFGVDPYGVEYAEEGVELNRSIFASAGVPDDHVIFCDAFDPEFLKANRNRFEVVLSRGVIEHFADPASVIAAHRDLVAPGGLLLISVPNYRGLNWLLKWTFDGHSLPGHNLDTMRPEIFRAHIEHPDFETLFCGPYGSIHISISQPNRRRGVKWALYMICEKAQLLLNAFLRALFGKKGPESRYTSPFMLYAGRKKP